MGLQKTGYSEKTSKHYLIDAGTIYTNVTHTAEGGFTGELHGATSGGVSLEIEQEYRDIEVDGTGYTKVKGNKLLVSASAKATANMKEITAETIRRSLNASMRDAEVDEAPTGYKVIESKRHLEDSDYLDNIAIVGTLTGTNEPIIAILDNALCISGLGMEQEDDNEAIIEQEYEAHASHEQLVAEALPWRILYPDVDKVE